MITPSDSRSFSPSPAQRNQGHHSGSVLNDATLTIDEKRRVLASEASDARAVADHPALRRLDDGRIVGIDDILDDLKKLDGFPIATTPNSQSNERSCVTVQATFQDFVDAEIACALLSDASLQAGEPEAVGLKRWLVQVGGITPALARRAEAVLRSARASETRIVVIEQVVTDRRMHGNLKMVV